MALAGVTGLAPPSTDWSAYVRCRQSRHRVQAHVRTVFQWPTNRFYRREESEIPPDMVWQGRTRIGRYMETARVMMQKSPEKHWEKFLAQGKPRINFRLARHQLRGCTQAPNESVDAFVRRLRTIAADCEYTNVNEQLIVDRVSVSIQYRDGRRCGINPGG